MKSTKMLVTTGGALLLVVVATVAAALHLIWLAVLALGLLLTAQLVVAMDTNRRTRYLPGHVKRLLRSVPVQTVDAPAPRAGAPTAQQQAAPQQVAVAQQDVTGAVRLIQAQYVGRLDRAQSALEAAAEDLRAARDER